MVFLSLFFSFFYFVLIYSGPLCLLFVAVRQHALDLADRQHFENKTKSNCICRILRRFYLRMFPNLDVKAMQQLLLTKPVHFLVP